MSGHSCRETLWTATRLSAVLITLQKRARVVKMRLSRRYRPVTRHRSRSRWGSGLSLTSTSSLSSSSSQKRPITSDLSSVRSTLLEALSNHHAPILPGPRRLDRRKKAGAFTSTTSTASKFQQRTNQKRTRNVRAYNPAASPWSWFQTKSFLGTRKATIFRHSQATSLEFKNT